MFKGLRHKSGRALHGFFSFTGPDFAMWSCDGIAAAASALKQLAVSTVAIGTKGSDSRELREILCPTMTLLLCLCLISMTFNSVKSNFRPPRRLWLLTSPQNQQPPWVRDPAWPLVAVRRCLTCFMLRDADESSEATDKEG